MINFPKCKETIEMIWGGDHDVENDDGGEAISSNLSCHKCNTIVIIYWGEEND